MKLVLLLASAVSFGTVAGAALAQTQPPLPPAVSAAPKDAARMPPPSDGDDASLPDGMDDETAGVQPERGDRSISRRGRKGPRFGDPARMMPSSSRAAHFRIENGSFRFEVKCAEDEPMQACAEIVSKLFGEAKGLPMR